MTMLHTEHEAGARASTLGAMVLHSCESASGPSMRKPGGADLSYPEPFLTASSISLVFHPRSSPNESTRVIRS